MSNPKLDLMFDALDDLDPDQRRTVTDVMVGYLSGAVSDETWAAALEAGVYHATKSVRA